MKKFIFCLLSVFIATGAIGDLLIGPSPKEKQSMQASFSKCTSDKPLLKRDAGVIQKGKIVLGDLSCVSCDWDGVAIKGCEKCPNRVKIGDKCYKKCSTNKPLLISNGKCLACDEAGTNAEVSGGVIISGCEKCLDRIIVEGRCYRKCQDDKPLIIRGAGVEYVNNKPVPNGGCKTCDADGIGIYGCEKCSNRTVIDGKCYRECPDDKPLLFSDGSCRDCDAREVKSGKFRLQIISGCEKCANRQIVNDKCYTKCGDDKPIMTSDGQCWPCYYDKALPGSVSVISGCERCLDRKVIIGAICDKKNEK